MGVGAQVERLLISEEERIDVGGYNSTSRRSVCGICYPRFSYSSLR
jgi:hypothetical protein